MSLPGCAAIPAPYRERGRSPTRPAPRIVGNGVGGSQAVRHPDAEGFRKLHRRQFGDRRLDQRTDPYHALARHIGVDLSIERIGRSSVTRSRSWSTCSRPASISAKNIIAPAACPRWVREIDGAPAHPRRRHGPSTATPWAKNCRNAPKPDGDVIRTYDKPLVKDAGFLSCAAILFDSAIMKTSVISKEFRRALSGQSERPQRVRGTRHRVRGPGGLSQTHRRPFRSTSTSTASCFVRGHRPDRLSRRRRGREHAAAGGADQRGILSLPCIGDGRQSGTSGSPSIPQTRRRKPPPMGDWRS